MNPVHQIAVVDVALCLTLLLAGVPLLVQLCVYWNTWNTVLFFISDEWQQKILPPHVYIQTAQNETGKSKMP